MPAVGDPLFVPTPHVISPYHAANAAVSCSVMVMYISIEPTTCVVTVHEYGQSTPLHNFCNPDVDHTSASLCSCTNSIHTAASHSAGQHPKGSAYCTDLESGKQKFLPNSSQHSPTERDYVARYGQKAYRTGSGNEMGSMPQPLTPGHTDTVRIKALTDHEAPAPGIATCTTSLPSGHWFCMPTNSSACHL